MEPEFKIFFGIIGLITTLILAILCLVIVPAGHVGIYNLFGQVDDNELNPGLHLKLPWAGIHSMSVKTQEYTMTNIQGEGAKDNADSIIALSKEGLKVDLDITILYSLNPQKANEVYKTIGENYVNIIVRPQVSSVIPEITAKFEAKSIYSKSRTQVAMEIQNKLREQLEPKGIRIESVLLREVKLPEKISQAIELKLAAEQQIEQKEFEVEREKMEAERRVVEADGIARANEIISNSLTTNYLNWYWIESLPNHQSVMYVPTGNNGMPMFKSIQ